MLKTKVGVSILQSYVCFKLVVSVEEAAVDFTNSRDDIERILTEIGVPKIDKNHITVLNSNNFESWKKSGFKMIVFWLNGGSKFNQT